MVSTVSNFLFTFSLHIGDEMSYREAVENA
jgi:hypothetical protein